MQHVFNGALAVGGGRVAGDHHDLDGLFVVAQAVPIILIAQQKLGALENVLEQQVGLAHSGVVAVGHIGLIGQVDHVFLGEIGLAVGTLGSALVVVFVVFHDGVKNRKSARS